MGDTRVFCFLFKGLTIKHENHNCEVRGERIKRQEQKMGARKGPLRPVLLGRALLVLLIGCPGWRKAEGYTEHLADLTLD